MKLWRVATLTLIGLGMMYIISNLVYDFTGTEWFVLRVMATPTMIYGLFCITWGLMVWWNFGDKK